MKLLPTILLSLTCLFTVQQAVAESTPYSVALNWQHLPGADPTLVTQMVTKVPGATLLYQKWTDGLIAYSLEWDDLKAGCSVLARDQSLVAMKCVPGSDAFYYLAKNPHQAAKLYFFVVDGTKPVEHIQPETPKLRASAE